MAAMSSVLVTGAAGFIGAHVACGLSRSGHRVLGCDRLGDGAMLELAQGRMRSLLDPTHIRCVRADLADGDALDHLLTVHSIDTVVHLAWRRNAGRAGTSTIEAVQSNLLSFTHVLDACRRHRIRRLLFAGAWTEAMAPHVDRGSRPDAPSAPSAFEVATGVAQEALARAASAHGGPSPVALRMPAVYGPWCAPDDIACRLVQAARAGHRPADVVANAGDRALVHVDDVVHDIVLLAMDGADIGHEDAVSVGRTNELALQQFARCLESELFGGNRDEQAVMPHRARVRAMLHWLDAWAHDGRPYRAAA